MNRLYTFSALAAGCAVRRESNLLLRQHETDTGPPPLKAPPEAVERAGSRAARGVEEAVGCWWVGNVPQPLAASAPVTRPASGQNRCGRGRSLGSQGGRGSVLGVPSGARRERAPDVAEVECQIRGMRTTVR